MKVVIAEKPKVAGKIAKAIGELKTHRKGKVTYYFNKDTAVLPAVGHLFTLAEEKKSFSYPTLNYKWLPAFKASKSSYYTRQYIDLMKSFSEKASEVIVACDYDIEGTLIGYNVARFIFSGKPIFRMKFSTLTPYELSYAFENLKDFDILNAYAGEARHTIDWLYGINLSRALMLALKKAGWHKVMSIGRVQGPTLHLASKKEKEIISFEPKDFWQLFIYLKGVRFEYEGGKIFNKEKVDELKERIEDKAYIKQVIRKEVQISPYPPFDLTSLQVEAYSKLRISPNRTLQIAQSLYEKSLISYPRTSSQKLPARLGLRKIIEKLSEHNKEYSKWASKLLEKERLKPREGKKDDPAHPAIHPTGLQAEMNNEERKLYELIVSRFLACFGEPAKKEIVSVVASAGLNFKAKGEMIVEKGWIDFYPYYKGKDISLPQFNEGEEIDIVKVEVKKDKTKPPSRYTEASLVSELEKRNLGTKATRAVIVDTLFKRGYFRRDGGIHVTKYGLSVDSVLEKYVPDIVDEKMTRKLEEEMNAITTGKKDKEEVIEHGKEVLLHILEEFRRNEEEIGKELLNSLKETEKELTVIGKCKCGGDLRIIYNKKSKSYFVGCSNYPNCKVTYSLPRGYLFKPANEVCPYCGVPMVAIKKKGTKRRWGKICINPDCPGKNKK